MVKPEPLKYGLITDVANFAHLTTSSLHNIGDNIQSHAVEHLYASMGLAPEPNVAVGPWTTSTCFICSPVQTSQKFAAGNRTPSSCEDLY